MAPQTCLKGLGSGQFVLGQDYDKLQKGLPGQPLYSYTNPDADIRSYHRILLERVRVLYPKEKGVSSDWLTVANNFYSQIEKELSRNPENLTLPACFPE